MSRMRRLGTMCLYVYTSPVSGEMRGSDPSSSIGRYGAWYALLCITNGGWERRRASLGTHRACERQSLRAFQIVLNTSPFIYLYIFI